MMSSSRMSCGALNIAFIREAGCLPERVSLTERDGTEVRLPDRTHGLEAELADDAVIHPAVPDGGASSPAVYKRATAHDANLRVAVYMRSNEISTRKNTCAWFREYLRPGYDDLYMDYDAPDSEFAL